MTDLFTPEEKLPPTAIELHSRGLRCDTCKYFEQDFAGFGLHMCGSLGIITARPGDFCSRHSMFPRPRKKRAKV
jgi:hypothetical protein